MRKLMVFNSISADGFFTDKNSDMSWAHKQDPEWIEFTNENAGNGGELLFGRVTYDLMKAFWPTEQAAQMFPEVAKSMNKSRKVVFSRSMDTADWENTRVVKGDLVEQVRGLKEESGPGMVLMGSGSIVAQLAPYGVIDEYQMIVNPIVLGDGRTMFEGNDRKIDLKLVNSRTFKNGNVLLVYQPAP